MIFSKQGLSRRGEEFLDTEARAEFASGFVGLESLEARMLLSADFIGGVLTVSGTEGDDTIRIMAGPEAGQVVVMMAPGVDEGGQMFEGVEAVVVMGLGGADVIEAAGKFEKANDKHDKKGKGDKGAKGAKVMSVELNGGEGIDTLDLSGAESKVDVDLLKGEVKKNGYGSKASVEGIENLIGSAFGDKLVGDRLANVIEGGGGKDHIRGGDGDDTLLGGDGDDHIDGNDGADLIRGGDGKDHIKGGKGDDVIYGEGGKDHLKGDDGNDELYGGDGDDKLCGGKGDDLLVGNAGEDKLCDKHDGEHGHDQLYADDLLTTPEPPADPSADDSDGDAIEYIEEREPNDSEQFANEYTMVLNEPLLLTGEASMGDSDYIELTAANDGALNLNVTTDSTEPVTIRIFSADMSFELFTYTSDDLTALLGLGLQAGTTFIVKIESTSTTDPVRYFVDVLQTSM